MYDCGQVFAQGFGGRFCKRFCTSFYTGFWSLVYVQVLFHKVVYCFCMGCVWDFVYRFSYNVWNGFAEDCCIWFCIGVCKGFVQAPYIFVYFPGRLYSGLM